MRQKLGQHFLKNKEAIKTILQALEIKAGDIIIEVGSGHGELTRLIAAKLKIKNKKSKIIAIEKDKKLAEFLRKKFASDKNVEIIEGDALKILPQIVDSILRTSDVQNLKIVGNIPYYITGHLLRIFSELKNKPSLIVLTLQKEVGLRICGLQQAQAKPKMNLLAASVRFWAKPEIIGYIPKKKFRPEPKVDSAIIKLENITSRGRSSKKCYELEKNYYRLIRILFKQPRKTILNNLLFGLAKEKKYQKNLKTKIAEKLKNVNIEPGQRPQDLSLNQLITLSQILYN